MGRFVIKRLIYMVITLWVIATGTFFLMHSLPGSPLENEDRIPPELREQILEQYGLNDPLPVQYVKFLGDLVQGDLGNSFKYDGRSITAMIMEGFPASAQLGLQAMIFGVLVGVALGTVSALRRGSWVDNGSTVLSVLGYAVPSFTLAALFSYYVGVVCGVLPTAGWGTFAHSILASLSLSFLVIAQITRYVRTEMLEVLGQDYMKTARAKGLNRK